MYTFYNNRRGYFLSTNTKVLSSTLFRQEELERASRWYELINNFKKRLGVFQNQPHYLLVRNPFTRLESFFREKLRSKVALITSKETPYRIKLHQRIFFRFAKIKEDEPDYVKKEKLENFSWNQFISALPKVYRLDAHLRPQSKILNPTIRHILPVKIYYDRIFKIENSDDMNDLSNLGINLSIKANRTSKENSEICWNHHMIELVQNIYKDDFLNFKYDFEYPHNI